MVNLLIAGNVSDDGDGGAGLLLDGSFVAFPLTPPNYPAVTATIVNCTIANNHTDETQGGGVYLRDDDTNDPNDPNVAFYNCIFWGNVASGASAEEDQIDSSGGIGLTVEYCDIQNCDSFCPGTGNISGNPDFFANQYGAWTANGSYDPDTYQVTFTANPSPTWVTDEHVGRLINPDTDYTDQQFVIVANTSTTITVWADFETMCPDLGPGENFPTACEDPNSWVLATEKFRIYDYRLLSECTPACKDAGDDSAIPDDLMDLDGDSNTAEYVPYDLDDDTRIVGDDVDMGAYEYDGNPTCWGDLNLDDSVGLVDLNLLLGNYGQTSGMGYFDGDMDCDGDVQLDDLSDLLGE